MKNGQPQPLLAQPAIRFPHPKGLLRLAMRFPILFYRLRLGWILGGRFLLLEHRGRRTGALRQVVLEVVDHDPARGSYVVAAAWGRQADWYKNICADPRVHVTVGTRRFAAEARTLSEGEARHHLETYAIEHPAAFKELGSLLAGKRSRSPAEAIDTFVALMKIVELAPLQAAPHQAGPHP
jgi:deazaflavin-dependent oxidoreductase (nitroreductase family)